MLMLGGAQQIGTRGGAKYSKSENRFYFEKKTKHFGGGLDKCIKPVGVSIV